MGTKPASYRALLDSSDGVTSNSSDGVTSNSSDGVTSNSSDVSSRGIGVSSANAVTIYWHNASNSPKVDSTCLAAL